MELIAPNWLNQLQVGLQVLIAACLAGAVGLERELAHRPAGLRTHAILGAAAALLVGLADLLVDHFFRETSLQILRADPIRVVEAIVTGTAFLGAGTIFRNRDSDVIEGLTTAASLLLVAAIGIGVALGQLLLSVIVTGFTILMLRIVGIWSNRRLND